MACVTETKTTAKHARIMSILLSEVLLELQVLPPHHERTRVGRSILEILDTLDGWEITDSMDSSVLAPDPLANLDQWDVV